MKKNIINLALFSTVAFMLGCGSNSGSGTCPNGEIMRYADGVAGTCSIPTVTTTVIQTNTATSTQTSSVTGTSTVTSTATSTNTSTSVTTTATATATSTFVYSDACDYRNDNSVTGGGAIKRQGLWTVSTSSGVSWNLCVTQLSSIDIGVNAYAFKTSEIGQTNPPSLVAYHGVMGNKCVTLYPNTTTSDGPTVQGNGVIGNSVSGFTISDGVTTATWVAQGTAIPGCPYPQPGT